MLQPTRKHLKCSYKVSFHTSSRTIYHLSNVTSDHANQSLVFFMIQFGLRFKFTVPRFEIVILHWDDPVRCHQDSQGIRHDLVQAHFPIWQAGRRVLVSIAVILETEVPKASVIAPCHEDKKSSSRGHQACHRGIKPSARLKSNTHQQWPASNRPQETATVDGAQSCQDLTLQGNGDEAARASHDKHDQMKLTGPRPERYIPTTACFQAVDVEVPAGFLDAHWCWTAWRTGGWCSTQRGECQLGAQDVSL